MLRIVEPSAKLLEFIRTLNLLLSSPQLAHAIGFIDSLITLDERRSLARANRLLGKPTDQSALSDFFKFPAYSVEISLSILSVNGS